MTTTNTNTVTVTDDVVVIDAVTKMNEDLAKLPTTSAKIRYLTTLKMARSDIAKLLDIRYQHVRNVQLQPLKKTEAK